MKRYGNKYWMFVSLLASGFVIMFVYSTAVLLIDRFAYDNSTPYLILKTQQLDTSVAYPGQRICLTSTYTKRHGCRGFINYTLKERGVDVKSAHIYNIIEYQGVWPSGIDQVATTCIVIPRTVRKGEYTLGWEATNIRCQGASKLFEAENDRIPLTILSAE